MSKGSIRFVLLDSASSACRRDIVHRCKLPCIAERLLGCFFINYPFSLWYSDNPDLSGDIRPRPCRLCRATDVDGCVEAEPPNMSWQMQ